MTEERNHADILARLLLRYIEASLMARIQITPFARMLIGPVQSDINDALRDAGYGDELDKILNKYMGRAGNAKK